MKFSGMARIILVTLGYCAPSSPGTVDITVRIINKAQAPGDVVMTAQRIAAGVFVTAGIETNWDQCPAVQAPPHPCPEYTHGPAEILMIINADATRRSPPRALGISLPLIGYGNRAGVFYSRIEATAREATISLGASVAEVLGHVMAHEIGHLLLGWTTHESEGLMRGVWTMEEYYAMRCSKLLFSGGEAAQMRRAIVKRGRKQDERMGVAPSGRSAL